VTKSLANKPKVLLLSGYDAASHRHWRSLLEQHLTEFHWTQLALPDRHFYWRARGNSLTFAFEHKERLEQHYDCLIVTSMVDLSALRGFVPSLAKLPTLIYFHENQFAYPVSKRENANSNLINVQLTSIYSTLCADRVLFNSEYNRKTFIDGASRLLDKMPDLVPENLLDKVSNKTEVLPVPIADKFFANLSSRKNVIQSNGERIQILWNHRWEFDKQPEVFFVALKNLKSAGIRFGLHVVGQVFRQSPNCFQTAKLEFEEEIESWGYQDREMYCKVLARADIVVSAALHDFQGLSMLEAMASGCIPVAPNRVAYPEYIAEEQLYENGSSTEDEAARLFDKLIETIDRLHINSALGSSDRASFEISQEKVNKASYNLGVNPKTDLSHYAAEFLTGPYRDELNQLISTGS